MSLDVVMKLDDIGLFKKRQVRGQIREQWSQRERAEQIRDEFARCMSRALLHNDCAMPGLCAIGATTLSCMHLHVDYANFTGNGIPLTGNARKKIDSRLRAIGTQVYREQQSIPASTPLAGDVHIPALARCNTFTGGPRRASSKPRAVAAKKKQKKPGFWSRLLFS